MAEHEETQDVLDQYRQAGAPVPERYRLWPLYGAGFENLGRDGAMIEVELPKPGPRELAVRHDAVGICFSDIKVIKAGQNHPRIYRNMREQPVVLGHEVALTVVDVGEELRDDYQVGDRFIVQADIYIKGKSIAYGYEIQGGFSQYAIVDERVLAGDDGNYLLQVQPETGYAEAALNEPWACVIASYGVDYRPAWKPGGALWIVGDGAGASLGAAAEWDAPGRIVLDVTDAAFAGSVGAAFGGKADIAQGGSQAQDAGQYDDIVVLSNDPGLIERAFPRLARGGTFAIVTTQPVERWVQLDIGRIHYDRLALIGTDSGDVAAAYGPIRTELEPDGRVWMLGAGGPMGQMHVQRAIEMEDGPRQIVATNIHVSRLDALADKYADLAHQHGVEFLCYSRESFAGQEEMDETLSAAHEGEGFEDIVVLAPSTSAVEAALKHTRQGTVMNIFAGLPRGTMSGFDVNLVIRQGVRFTGISGSSIDDLRTMLNLVESHELETNRSVVAVASLAGLPAGLHGVAEGRFPGKVVIYPQIRDLPLTPLEDLENVLPNVAAKLSPDGGWTNEAEEELLRTLLPRGEE